MKPFEKTPIAARNCVKECALNIFGDGAAFTRSDNVTVNFADRRYLGGGSREKGLVGVQQVVDFQRLLLDLITDFRGYFDGGIACNAHKNGVVGLIRHDSS